MVKCIIFFFSSRRRHTRYWRDWSSDVCSSDLGVRVGGGRVKIGVTIFPGSNCDRDALYAVERMGAEPVELWHADADLKSSDAVIVPGGFSYGDYLRPGAIARFAKVDRKSTRLNSSHANISYAVFCLKKK